MCCSVLQCVAVCCSVLQRVAVLQCAAVWCSVVQCVAEGCIFFTSKGKSATLYSVTSLANAILGLTSYDLIVI